MKSSGQKSFKSLTDLLICSGCIFLLFLGLSFAQQNEAIQKHASHRVMQTLSLHDSFVQAYASLKTEFGPYAKRLITNAKNPMDELDTLKILATIDPAWVFPYLQSQTFENEWFGDYIRWAGIEPLLKTNFDDAVTMIQNLEMPMWRCMGYVNAADSLAENHTTQAMTLLTEAVLNAKAVEAPDKKLSCLSTVAKQLLKIGKTEEAKKLLKETLPLAESMSTKEWPGYARGSFAEVLVRIDYDAALSLVTGYTDDFDHDRHHGNMAHQLAGKNPAQAEAMLHKLRTQPNRDRWSSRVCYHMVPLDTDRARRIAESIDQEHLKAHALGMMAHSLTDSDKAQAQNLIQEAFALLESKSSHQSRGRMPSLQDVGLSLLPVVEGLDAALVEKYLLKTLSLGSAPRSITAACLARYDRKLAQQWLPTYEATKQKSRSFYFAALAAIDPQEAIQQAHNLNEDTDADKRMKSRAWAQIVTMMSKDTLASWDWMHDRYMNLWYVGQDDI